MVRQHAVLPYIIIDGEVRVMLVTSRDTKRWVIPKGWPEKNLSAHDQAAVEAYEEAGVKGEVEDQPIGEYHYVKGLKADKEKICRVDVYPMLVETQLLDWPEKGQREQTWVRPSKAARMVHEQELSWILKSFTPHDSLYLASNDPGIQSFNWFKGIFSALR